MDNFIFLLTFLFAFIILIGIVVLGMIAVFTIAWAFFDYFTNPERISRRDSSHHNH